MILIIFILKQLHTLESKNNNKVNKKKITCCFEKRENNWMSFACFMDKPTFSIVWKAIDSFSSHVLPHDWCFVLNSRPLLCTCTQHQIVLELIPQQHAVRLCWMYQLNHHLKGMVVMDVMNKFSLNWIHLKCIKKWFHLQLLFTLMKFLKVEINLK